MRKLKQSSALLLVVSLLLSIFSFSAFAAGNRKVNLHINPRLLTENELNERKDWKLDGNKNDNFGGLPIKNAKFTLYKIGGVEVADPDKAYKLGDDSFPFDKSQQEHKVTVNGEEKSFWSNDNGKEVTTKNDGDGIIEIEDANFGWYIAIMDDKDEMGCLPVFIYVNTNNQVKDTYSYPKVVRYDKEGDLPDIKKYIIGNGNTKYIAKTVDLSGNEEERIIKYRLDVDVPKLVGRYKDNNEFLAVLNSQFPIFKVHDRALSLNPIVDQITSEQLKNKYPVSVRLVWQGGSAQLKEGADNDYVLSKRNGRGITVDFRRHTLPNGQGDRGFSDNVAKLIRAHRDAHFEIEFSVQVRDLTQYFSENKPHEEKANDGSKKNILDYEFVFRKGNLSFDGLRSQMKEKGNLNANPIADDIGESEIESVREKCEPYLGQELKDNGDLGVEKFDGGVRKYLQNLMKTSGKLGDIKNPLKESEKIKLTDGRKQAFTDILKVENKAYIEIKTKNNNNTRTIMSNSVRTQFGVLWVRKLDSKGNSLKGSEFELFDATKKKSFGKGHAEECGDRYFIVPVGENVLYSTYANQGKDAINEFIKTYPTVSTKYYLQETKAPDGYEKINKPFEVLVAGTFNYLEVNNVPGINLPFTGGMGTILFTVVGILLIGSGAYLLINSKRKKSF